MTHRRMMRTWHRAHMVMMPTRRRRRRAPGVDHDRAYDRRLDGFEPRTVAMRAGNRPVGVLNDAISVTHRADRSVIIIAADPGARIHASRAERKGRCNQNCLDVRVHVRLAFCLLTSS